MCCCCDIGEVRIARRDSHRIGGSSIVELELIRGIGERSREHHHSFEVILAGTSVFIAQRENDRERRQVAKAVLGKTESIESCPRHFYLAIVEDKRHMVGKEPHIRCSLRPKYVQQTWDNEGEVGSKTRSDVQHTVLAVACVRASVRDAEQNAKFLGNQCGTYFFFESGC